MKHDEQTHPETPAPGLLYGVRTRDRWFDWETSEKWRTERTSAVESYALEMLRNLRRANPRQAWQLWETAPGRAPVLVEGYN